MDSFELNKIIGAILGTLLFVMGVGFLAEAIYTPRVTTAQSFDLPEPTEAAASGAATTAAPKVSLAELLSKANAANGAQIVKKCHACHDFTEGGPNKIGPNLYGVVDRPIASHPGFSYDDALKAHANDKWTYENLSAFIHSPKTFAPGTKMTFAGISDDKDRADVLAYLQTLSHSPVPFPTPAPAGTAGDVKAPAQAAGTAAPASEPAATATGTTTAPAAPATAETPAASSTAQPAPAAPTTAPSEPAASTSAAPSAADQVAPAASGQ